MKTVLSRIGYKKSRPTLDEKSYMSETMKMIQHFDRSNQSQPFYILVGRYGSRSWNLWRFKIFPGFYTTYFCTKF